MSGIAITLMSIGFIGLAIMLVFCIGLAWGLITGRLK